MNENKLILYKDDEGKVNVNVRFADEDMWLTRENLAEIYATTPQNISLHVGNIYQDQELSEEGTRKNQPSCWQHLPRPRTERRGNSKEILSCSSRGQATGSEREIDHYNLDNQILQLRKNILEGSGTVSHQEAIEKAEREFEIYREREMRMLESDFDRAVKQLKDIQGNAEKKNTIEN